MECTRVTPLERGRKIQSVGYPAVCGHAAVSAIFHHTVWDNAAAAIYYIWIGGQPQAESRQDHQAAVERRTALQGLRPHTKDGPYAKMPSSKTQATSGDPANNEGISEDVARRQEGERRLDKVEGPSGPGCGNVYLTDAREIQGRSKELLWELAE